MHDEPIHWFSIINSLMIVVFLTGMVAMIMLRTLHRDIAKYNQLETAEEAQEETGWKLVHGDVFRAPPRASLLATYVGTGVQLLGMSVVTMVRPPPPSHRPMLAAATFVLAPRRLACGCFSRPVRMPLVQSCTGSEHADSEGDRAGSSCCGGVAVAAVPVGWHGSNGSGLESATASASVVTCGERTGCAFRRAHVATAPRESEYHWQWVH